MKPLRISLPAPATGRLAVLDELKGVAILLVVLYHAGGVLSWPDRLHGEVGVDMFVILSGIGLALGTGTEAPVRFLVRRFWRIYPAYWVALSAFLLGDAFILGRHDTALDVALHYLGIHGWFGGGHAMSINDSFWFITLIVSLYLVYLPLRRFAARPDLTLFAGAVVSFTVSVILLRANQPEPFGDISLRLPGFFVGLVGGRLLKTGSLDISPTWALGGAFLLIFYAPYTQGFIYTSTWVGLAVMVVYPLVIRGVLSAKLRSVLAYLGVRSLEIFLIHQPLIREYNVKVLQVWFPTAVTSSWFLVIGMVVALVVTVELAAGLRTVLKKLPMPGLGGPRPSAA
jgi:peptidoglycan/LPS O-acetylase OafA/YrhL